MSGEQMDESQVAGSVLASVGELFLSHDFLFHQMISFLLATWKTQTQTPV